MYREFAAVFFSVAFGVMMIIYPSMSVDAVAEALKLWGSTVVPSLLPFFICSNFMLGIGFTDKLAGACEPVVRRFFKTSGCCAFPFIMSVASGYPVGVKIVADLRNANLITKKDADKAITFCSTSGPLFMIGAVGAGMLSNSVLGWIIAGAHYLGAVCNGFFYGRILGNENYRGGRIRRLSEESKSGTLQLSVKKDGRVHSTEPRNYNQIAAAAIMDSASTLFLIGGYMAVFMMVICFLQMICPNLAPWASGLLELSVGCNEAAQYVYYTQMEKTLLCTALISFGGVCVIAQSLSFIAKSDINIGLFLISKITHGIFGYIIAFAAFKIIFAAEPEIISAFSNTFNSLPMERTGESFIYSILFSGTMVCILFAIFILIVIIYLISDKIKKKRNISQNNRN